MKVHETTAFSMKIESKIEWYKAQNETRKKGWYWSTMELKQLQQNTQVSVSQGSYSSYYTYISRLYFVNMDDAVNKMKLKAQK